MYSPRLNKYRDSYALYIPTYSTRLRFGKLYTHSFGTDTHTHTDVPPSLSNVK